MEQHLQTIPIYDPHDPQEIPCDDEPLGGYNGDPALLVDLEGMEEPVPLPDPDHNEDAMDTAHGALTIESLTLTPGTTSDAEPQPPPVPEVHPTLIQRPQRVTIPHLKRPITFGREPTVYESRREFERTNGISPYRGFKNADIFEHAEWVISSELSQHTESNLLHTRVVSPSQRLPFFSYQLRVIFQLQRTEIPWSNARAMLQEVDRLPRCTSWRHRTLRIYANPHDQTGIAHDVDLFYRDPIELIKQLIGNPEFNHPDIIAYEAEEVWMKLGNGERARVYSEANTGSWWHTMQVSSLF
jgi:hypothetical protein